VRTASNGTEALECFQSEVFDLVVTDYRMPSMGGADLIRHIRARRPEIPIVLLSGFVEALGLSEESTGADAVIAKSAQEVQNLLRSVNRLLNPRQRNGKKAVPRKPPASQRAALVKKAEAK
jgi:CheY-like chemotaxis protein